MAPSATSTVQEYEAVYSHHKISAVNHNYRNPAEDQKALVKDVLKQRVDTINTDICEPGEEDAFFVADVGEVYRQHIRWKMNLKRIKPHYGKLPYDPRYTLECADCQ